MKNIIRVPLLLIVTLTLLMLSGCVPVPSFGGGMVIGQSYTLESGQTLNNDLTVVGGNAMLDQNSTVNGNVAVMGGNVVIDGTVNGDVTVMGGSLSIENNADIKGSVTTLGGSERRASGARVEGQDYGNRTPRITTLRTPAMHVSFDPITGPLMAIFQALALAALAVIVNLFAARHMERTGRAAMVQPAASGGVGCLTILVLVVMAITIILLPISLLGVLVGFVAALFGLLALGLLLGRQIAVWLKQPWSDPINAGVGTLVLSLLISLLNVIPCIGWLGGAIVWLVGLGAVVLTRFGTQLYPPPYSPAPVTTTGPYTPPPAAPSQQPGAQVYPPESDQPGGSPPAGTTGG